MSNESIWFLFAVLAAIVGFGVGIYCDLGAETIQEAIRVCEQANSTMKSTDFSAVTCANHAVIPLYAK